jgi:signal transduction histidine kinase
MIVTYVNEDKEFVFEIKDTGDGISKKDCAKIFNFFSQVNRSRLKRQQGSGLGLALCKTIAKAHKGDIYFKSRLNTGSTFWFELPMFGAY